jgi:putative membrane protein
VTAILATGAHPLVHLNAALNLLATLLLALGLWQIKRHREAAHGRIMIAALATSAVFLTSYLTYHFMVGRVEFTHDGSVKYVYYAILLSHVLLAFTVPFLAVAAAIFGARAVGWGRALELSAEERARFRARHIRVVRWAYPVWMYVSVTGVIVYAMLYHLWPSAEL